MAPSSSRRTRHSCNDLIGSFCAHLLYLTIRPHHTPLRSIHSHYPDCSLSSYTSFTSLCDLCSFLQDVGGGKEKAARGSHSLLLFKTPPIGLDSHIRGGCTGELKPIAFCCYHWGFYMYCRAASARISILSSFLVVRHQKGSHRPF